MTNIEGTIQKGVGGIYWVRAGDGKLIECAARGRFRLDGQTPYVGDHVTIIFTNKNELALIDEILPRKNSFKRPPIANVDQVVIAVSASTPMVDFLLLDKLLLHIRQANVQCVFCINKCDTEDEGIAEQIAYAYQGAGCQTLITSAISGQGVDELKKALHGKITCIAGQSGVGKSSLLNAIWPEFSLKTSQVSTKIGRGKHTTRHIELIALPQGGFVADTPGFSLLETDEMIPEELANFYTEFDAYLGNCKFRACIHDQEPGCAIKEAVLNKKIDRGRYERYIQILNEIKEKRRTRYD